MTKDDEGGETIDTAACPLCGGANRCAMAGGEAPADGACWCASVRISTEVLARVPARARDRACLCARCAAGEAAKEGAA
ncbi:MAG TPA: cysteine-rich CWC family protein [Longimicrobium sp.]|nr:cysteine-rich CWC family protein [Longimicrobium sp.]